MKLHLPCALRTALMACISTVAGLTTTVGTGVVTGGVITYALVAQQAQADVDLHGTTFTSAPNTGGYQNWTNVGNANWQLATTGFSFGNGLNIGGLYIAEGAGLKVNSGSNDVSVKYLYLASNIVFCNTTAGAANAINWSGNGANASLNIKDGGWADINADYTTRVSLAAMTTGDVYLNTAGALTLTNNGTAYSLNSGVTVHATMADGVTDRVLLRGDFSAWTGTAKVTIGGTERTYSRANATSSYGAYDGFMLHATAAGLQVAETTYLWAGEDAGSGSWNGTAWVNTTLGIPGGAYVNDVNVLFSNTDHTAATVTVAGATVAHNVTVEGGHYTISYADETASLAAQSITIADGATLVLGPDGTLYLGSPINVGTGATLTLDNANMTLAALPEGGGSGDLIFRQGTGDQAGKVLQATETKFYTGEGTVTGTATAKVGENTYSIVDGMAVVGSVVSESTTYVINDPTNASNIVIKDGVTVEVGAGSGLGVMYDAAPDRTITVDAGGVLDAKGVGDQKYHIVLNGGTFKNSGSAISSGSMQYPYLTLTDDSTVDTASRFGLLNSGHATAYLTLNGNTLTKTGTGTFHLSNTVMDAGAIDIQAGTLEILAQSGGQSELTGDMTITVQSGASLSCSGALKIGDNVNLTLGGAGNIAITELFNVNAGSTLTLDNANFSLSALPPGMEAQALVFKQGTGDQAGKTVQVASSKFYTGEGTVTGSATIKVGETSYAVTDGLADVDSVVSENTTYTINNPTFAGNIRVENGITVEVGAGGGLGVMYDAAPDRTITVDAGGVLDAKGVGDQKYHIVLNGGTFKNSGAGISSGSMQYPYLTLTDDSTVDTASRFGLLNSGHATAYLTLNGNTLTKTGTGTFHLSNTVMDAGAIDIQAGTLEILAQSGGQSELTGDMTITVQSGASLSCSGALKIADNVNLTLGGAGNITITDLFNINAGSTLTLDNANFSLSALPPGMEAQALVFKQGTGDQAGKTVQGATSKFYTGEGTVTGSATIKVGETSYAVTDGLTTVDSVVSDSATYTMDNGTFAGDIRVESGITLKQSFNDRMGANYIDNADRTITVANGGALDVSGREAYYHVVLEEGATLTNSDGGVAAEWRSLPVVDLEGDATVKVDSGHMFGMLGGGYGETYLNLQGHTLTKIGVGTFHTSNANITEGDIVVEGGKFEYMTREGRSATIAANSITVKDGAELDIRAYGASTLNITGTAISNCGRVRVEGGSKINIQGGSLEVENINTDNNSNNVIAIDGTKLNVGKIDLDNTIMSIKGDTVAEIGAIHVTGNTLTLDTDVNVNSLVLAARWNTQSIVNLEEGHTMHVKGTGLGVGWDNASFMLNHWSAQGILNINGGTVISEAGITGWDGTTVVNVNAGGTLQFNSALERNTDRSKSIAINLAETATLKVGGSTEQGAQGSLVVNMSNGSKLEGTGAAGVATANFVATGTAEILVDGTNALDIRGAVSGDATYKKTGSGTLSLTGDVSGLKNLSVTDGTVNITNDVSGLQNLEISGGTVSLDAGLSSADRVIDLAAGVVLDTALSLNGGTLTLDASGMDAGLGDNTLELGKGTILNLTISGEDTVGTHIGLLTSISSLVGVEGEGSLGLLSDYFTLGNIIDLSDPTSTVAQDDDINSWANRLNRSELVYGGGSLYLVLAENILSNSTLYWEPNDTGDGTWSGPSWNDVNVDPDSTNDPGVMATPWPLDTPPNVVFNGDADATVTVDTDAIVNNMTIEDGSYTFAQGMTEDGTAPTGSLVIEETLNVGENGSATLDMEATVKNIEVEGTGASLTVNEKLVVEESLTVGENGSATLNAETEVKNVLVEGASSSLAVNDKLVIQDTLNVGENGTVTLNAETNVKDIVLAGASSTVNVNSDVKLTEGGKWDASKGGTIKSGLGAGQSLVLTDAKLGGVATVSDGVISGNGVKLVGDSIAIIGSEMPEGELDTSIGTMITGQIDNSGCANLQLGGTIWLDTTVMGDLLEGQVTTFHDQNGGSVDVAVTGNNGYTKEGMKAKLFTSSGLVADPMNPLSWYMIDSEGDKLVAQVTPTDGSNTTFNILSGVHSTEYYACDSGIAAVYNSGLALFKDRATELVLKGGSFILETNLGTAAGSNDPLKIRADVGGGTVELGVRVTLDQSSLVENENTITLKGGKSAVYQLTYEKGSGSTEVHDNVTGLTDADGWLGTVNVGTLNGSSFDFSHLGNANSTVMANGITANKLWSGETGMVDVLGDVALDGGDSVVRDMAATGNVAIGSSAAASLVADSLTVNGADGLSLGEKSTATIANLAVTGGDMALGAGASVNAGVVEVNKALSLEDGAGLAALSDVTVGTELELGAGASVTAGALKVTEGVSLAEKATVETAGDMTVGGALKLGAEASVQAGLLDVTSGLTVGAGAAVKSDGQLSVGGDITYGDLAASITAGSLLNDSLSIMLNQNQMRDAAKATATSVGDTEMTLASLMEVTSGSAADVELNALGSNSWNPYGEKYGYTLDWDATGTKLDLTATANEDYMKQKYDGASHNAIAGATIMDDAFGSGAIGAGGDLEDILEGVDKDMISDADLAAVAGSSIAAVGMAFAGDVDRQLSAIRNRTTTMGVNQDVYHERMPYVNAWINAEGNLGELRAKRSRSGYNLDSWGGTVGMDLDFTPSLTAGMAVTAMYGDYTSDGPDKLEGDMDTCYVSAFARIADSAWTHTFVGTVGKADMSFTRNVHHANGGYETTGDTEGMAFGLMYELGYVIPLDYEGETCLQPIFNVAYRHTSVDGYTEHGGDAALKVGSQSYNTVTIGAGARLQSIIGENLYNRASMLEVRALVKFDAGDREGSVNTMFTGGNASGNVKSEEIGAVGIELGAGLNIPLGAESGTLFIDGGVEVRADYTNLNGTVGWRINF